MRDLRSERLARPARRRGRRRAARGGRRGRRRGPAEAWRWRRWRRPGAGRWRRTSSSPAPASTSTGIAEPADGGPHIGLWRRCRRGAATTARPAAVLRRRSATSAADRGQATANSGWASQRRGRRRRRRARWRRPAPRRSPAGRPARRRPRCPGGAEQHQPPATSSGWARASVQHEAAAHRVADVDARPPAASTMAPAPSARSAVRRPEPPWPGASTVDHLVVGGQVVGDGRPRPAGLGEAVDEHEAGPGALPLDVRWRRVLRRPGPCRPGYESCRSPPQPRSAPRWSTSGSGPA